MPPQTQAAFVAVPMFEAAQFDALGQQNHQGIGLSGPQDPQVESLGHGRRQKRSIPLADEVNASNLITEARLAAQEGNAGFLWQLACRDGVSSCLVQKAISMAGQEVCQTLHDHATVRAAAELLADLQGHVQEAVLHKHANYVIQAIVQHMPCTLSAFVARELAGNAIKTAKHKIGCRTLREISTSKW